MSDNGAYDAARVAAAFRDISAYGWLRLTGRDRLGLLHRLSTNDVKGLAAGSGSATLLTNASARVIAMLVVYSGAEAVLLRIMPGQVAPVVRYLQSMIFWQDEVTVEDQSGTTAQFALYGPHAGQLLEEMTGLDLTGLPEYAWVAAELDGGAVTIHRGGSLEPYEWTMTCGAETRAIVGGALAQRAPELDEHNAEAIRVEAGLPLWGLELSDQVTPLETGLLPAISFNKGCYTGQEVIARQTNYDKVTRNLVGLEFDAATDPGSEPAEKLKLGEASAHGGFVTSTAFSPALGKRIGLAVIPRRAAQPGTLVAVTAGEETQYARVRRLPFLDKTR